jgi:hypothetical protein
MYVNEFLPALARIVPKVVVVTPMPSKELKVQDAMEFTVQKKNGTSKIVPVK